MSANRTQSEKAADYTGPIDARAAFEQAQRDRAQHARQEDEARAAAEVERAKDRIATREAEARAAENFKATEAERAANTALAHRVEEARARFQRLRDRQLAEVKRLQALPATARAALLVAHDLRATEPKIAAALDHMAQHLASGDDLALKKYVEETITEE